MESGALLLNSDQYAVAHRQVQENRDARNTLFFAQHLVHKVPAGRYGTSFIDGERAVEGVFVNSHVSSNEEISSSSIEQSAPMLASRQSVSCGRLTSAIVCSSPNNHPWAQCFLLIFLELRRSQSRRIRGRVFCPIHDMRHIAFPCYQTNRAILGILLASRRCKWGIFLFEPWSLQTILLRRRTLPY